MYSLFIPSPALKPIVRPGKPRSNLGQNTNLLRRGIQHPVFNNRSLRSRTRVRTRTSIFTQQFLPGNTKNSPHLLQPAINKRIEDRHDEGKPQPDQRDDYPGDEELHI